MWFWLLVWTVVLVPLIERLPESIKGTVFLVGFFWVVYVVCSLVFGVIGTPAIPVRIVP
jgi:hypothetical protein